MNGTMFFHEKNKLDTIDDVLNIEPEELYALVKNNDTLGNKVYDDLFYMPAYTGEFLTEMKHLALIKCNLITLLANDKKFNKTTKFLIEKYDIEAVNSEKISLLMIASRTGNEELFKFLIEKKTNLDSQTTCGTTALMILSSCPNMENSLKFADLLIKAGANLDLHNIAERTALSICTSSLFYKPKFSIKMMELLIDAGTKSIDTPDLADNWTPLMTATYCYASVEAMKLLIDAGANLNFQDNFGRSPLKIAACYLKTESSIDKTKFLIDAGANLDLQDKKSNGGTVLIDILHGCYFNIKNQNKKIKLLIEAGANLNLPNNYGRTPLMEASGYSATIFELIDIVELLIESGAKMDLQDNEGLTALMINAHNFKLNSSMETIKLLLKKNANLYLQNKKGKTAYTLCKNKEARLYISQFVMLKVEKIRELSMNRMKEAFSVYNIAGNVFLYLHPK